jgi:hypothetical protein
MLQVYILYIIYYLRTKEVYLRVRMGARVDIYLTREEYYDITGMYYIIILEL